MAVDFDGSGSSDPDFGDTLEYAWDLDEDGQYDDSTAVSPNRTYTQVGTVSVGLRVTDDDGATDTDSVEIQPGNEPDATILTPAAGTRWSADEQIAFSGDASDPQEGALPPSALSWEITGGATPSELTGAATGTLTAPDRVAPNPLTLRLTASDDHGLQGTDELVLEPRTVDLTLATDPPGLALGLNGESAPAPFTRTVVEDSTNRLDAGSPQTAGGETFEWQSWSDGGAAGHAITADASRTFSALFAPFDVTEDPPPLELETLKVKIPKTVEGLVERGGLAMLRCNVACWVKMTLVAKGRVAEEIGIDGTIGSATSEPEAGARTEVVATLRKRALRKLEQADPRLRPKVKARFEARPSD